MSIIEVRVGGRFKIKRSTGSGTFGEIYIAQNVQTKEEVAVKLEDTKSKYPQLIYEAKILYALQGGSGIPNLIWCGQEGDYNILIMELLGDSLENLFNLCRNRFTLKTLLMIVDQTLQVIEHMHNKGFLHRDIKPENLLLGLDANAHLVHFIDFGLAKRYRDPKSGKHIPYREGKQLTGTARYASINTHQGIEQSRRDDLEALGYVFVYLFQGSLPWQGLKSQANQDKYGAIYEKKVLTPLKELCKGMPEEFAKYLEYCRKLRFDEKPDYVFLRRMFKELFIREGYEFDYVYDWILIPMSQRMDIDYQKVAFDIEMRHDDEFINKNLYYLDKKHEFSPMSDQQYKSNMVPEQEQKEEEEENTGKAAPVQAGKPKPRPKPIETEYLRTDYKLANMPSPVNMKSPNVVTQKKDKKEKEGKDCNMF